jgi:hypothetical protein
MADEIKRGGTREAHDALQSVNMILRDAVFQTEPRGESDMIPPGLWVDVLGHLRGALAKEAELISVIAGMILTAAEEADDDDFTSAQAAAKVLKAVEAAIVKNAKKLTEAQAHLKLYGKNDLPEDDLPRP